MLPEQERPEDPHSSIVPRSAAARASMQPTGLFSERTVSIAPQSASPGSMGPVPAPSAYVLHEVVGRGGMGEVWSATQAALERTVAVKRLIADSAEAGESLFLREEFRTEAVIAARLQHPNIVPVYDLGIDADGRPLMAMKLVEGRPWNRLIKEDFDRLEPTEFLEKHLPILVSMAQAVAYAHARGIVHRDLKPAQVMLGEFGEALLTDWGLAVVLEDGERQARRERRSAHLPSPATASNPAGTPSMMAPEQTMETAAGIGPWTDVYLLGGTLYCLLCGQSPHTGNTPAEAIQAARRGTVVRPEDRAPGRFVPPELAQLALRAMAPDPQDRIPSAKDFVAALTDYLSGAGKRRESDAACAEADAALARAADYAEFASALASLDRARALWAENPRIAALREQALAGFARAALSGNDLLLARLQAEQLSAGPPRDALLRDVAAAAETRRRAARQRRFAIAASFVLAATVIAGGSFFTMRLSRALGEAERQRTLVLGRLEGTGSLVDMMLEKLVEKLDLQRPADQEIAKVLGQGVVEYYRGVDDSQLSGPLLAAQAKQLAKTASRFEALELYGDAKWLAVRAMALGQRDPAAAMHAVDAERVLASAELELGDLAKAEEILRGLLERLGPPDRSNWESAGDVLSELAMTLAKRDKAPEALPYAEAMIALNLKYGDPNSARTGNAYNNYGFVLSDLGRKEEALAAYLKADELRGGNASTLNNIGSAYGKMGEFALGLEYLERALDAALRSSGPQSSQTAMMLGNLGSALDAAGKHAQAIDAMKRSVETFDAALGPDHPLSLASRQNLSTALRNIDRHADAIAMIDETLPRIVGKLGKEHYYYGGMLINKAQALREMGRTEEALAAITEASEHLKNPSDVRHLCVAIATKGQILQDLGRLEEAEATFGPLIDLASSTLGPEHPEVATYLNNFGSLCVRLGKPEEAIKHTERALAIRRKAYGEVHSMVANGLDNLARAYDAAGNKEKYLQFELEACDVSLRADGPLSTNTGNIANNLAVALRGMGRVPEAIPYGVQALDSFQAVFGYDAPRTQTMHFNLALYMADTWQFEEALAMYREFADCWAETGPDRPVERLAEARERVAYLTSVTGDHTAALALARHAAELAESELGPSHAFTMQSWGRLVFNQLNLARSLWPMPESVDAYLALIAQAEERLPQIHIYPTARLAMAEAYARTCQPEKAVFWADLIWGFGMRDPALWARIREELPEYPLPDFAAPDQKTIK